MLLTAMAWITSRSFGGFLSSSFGHKRIPFNASKGIYPLCVPTANITGKALRDPNKKRPPPFPYREKVFPFLDFFHESTTHRFDENSKVIVVDGPIAVGKSTFAKALAEDLDMLHFPEATLAYTHTDLYGNDVRHLDPLLPEICRSIDIKQFYENPHAKNMPGFQHRMYHVRYSQYVDALVHLLSTGQGVVLERSPYSDFVFLEAMQKLGLVSKGASKVYYEIFKCTIQELLRPHLVIYLDIPVSKVKERIKKRAIPYELKTKVLSDEYLSTIEEAYKQKYLKLISTHAELLVYDWSDYGDAEVVVEDIERIDFDRFVGHDLKMKDWRDKEEEEWMTLRRRYTNHYEELLVHSFNIPMLDAPELFISGQDVFDKNQVFDKLPGHQYALGYNADMGDKGLLFKTAYIPFQKYTMNKWLRKEC